MSVIRKSKAILTDHYYNTPQTSTLMFHFEPQLNPSIEERLVKSRVEHISIEGKDLYLIDDFFSESEAKEVRAFSQKASFSRNSYGSPEAIAKGEKPAKSMNGKERWQFFSQPTEAIKEIYQLLSHLACRMDADISTLPWEMCDQKLHGSPAVMANMLEEATYESMEMGKHQDSSSEAGIAFSVPVLYGEENSCHPSKFINGEAGRPWLISLMLYSTAENFKEDFRMGTAFYKNENELAICADCKDMRLVIFEGDIFHSIEESKLPPGIQTWRVSYVFKLIVNPRRGGVSMKQFFSQTIHTATMPAWPSGNLKSL